MVSIRFIVIWIWQIHLSFRYFLILYPPKKWIPSWMMCWWKQWRKTPLALCVNIKQIESNGVWWQDQHRAKAHSWVREWSSLCLGGDEVSVGVSAGQPGGCRAALGWGHFHGKWVHAGFRKTRWWSESEAELMGVLLGSAYDIWLSPFIHEQWTDGNPVSCRRLIFPM